MNSLLLNTATTSVIFEGPTLMYLYQRFGENLSISNEEFATYLEEAVCEVFVNAKMIELISISMSQYSLEAKFKLIFDGISSPEDVVKEYMLSFKNLEECIDFANDIKLNLRSRLLKYDGKYYFYITTPLSIKMEEKIIENLAAVMFDPLTICRILEHAEVIIESRAMKTLREL